MTELHDVARAVSLTKLDQWGTKAQVLLALAAEPAPFGSVQLCMRDLARVTGLDLGQVSRAVRWLASHGCISVDPGRGQEASAYFVREPKEWRQIPWRIEHRDVATIIDASFGLHVRALDLDSARVWARARARSPRAGIATVTSIARASGRARSEGLARASGRARYGGPSPSPHVVGAEAPPPPVVVTLSGLRRGEEFGLTERQRRLCEAFMVGVAIEELRGYPLARLKRIASECNGELERLCALAAGIPAPARWMDRVLELERAMVEERREAAPAGRRFLPGTGWVDADVRAGEQPTTTLGHGARATESREE